jgi:hypothetical protein
MEHSKEVASKPKSRILPGSSVRLSGQVARLDIPSEHKCAGEPRIDVIRQGEIIQAIDVTCTCGKVIRLQCLYS